MPGKAFNSSLKDTGEPSHRWRILVFNFQFLIKGYNGRPEGED